MSERKQTKESIIEQLEWSVGDFARISILADIAEEEGDEGRAAELRVAAQIGKATREMERGRKELLARREKEDAIYAEQYRMLQRQCSHPVTKYYPDASGNNDSHTICLCCGKDV